MSESEFSTLLSDAWPDLSSEMVAKVNNFRALLLEENAHQNLTRIIEKTAFIDGHVIDVRGS